MDSPATFADLLRPYTKSRIAEHVGVSKQTVHQWSTGEWLPTSDKIAPLAEFLRIDIGELATLIAESAAQRKAKNAVGRAS